MEEDRQAERDRVGGQDGEKGGKSEWVSEKHGLDPPASERGRCHGWGELVRWGLRGAGVSPSLLGHRPAAWTRAGQRVSPLTIGGVWPEGDLDLKLLVGVLDGGQGQVGLGALREVGHHPLCNWGETASCS